MNHPRTRLLLIVIGILAGAYLFDVVLIEPALTRLDAANKNLEKANKQLQNVNTQLAQENALRQKINGIRLEVSKRDEAKVQKSLNDILAKVGRPNLKSVPEKKKTDNFSEVLYTIDGEGHIDEVAKLIYDLTYLKDYFKLHVKSMRGRGGNRVDFSLTGSALMGKAPANPTPGLSGLVMPERPREDKYRPIASRNIFSPPGVKEKVDVPRPRDPRKVDVKVTAIVMTEGGPEVLLESQGKSTWVKKGDKFNKYTVTDIVKQGAGADGVLKDQIVLDRGKSHVTIKYGETGRILHEDERDDEESSSR